MNRGIYTAVTGMIYNQRAVDAISNNIANVNTTGFKRDVTVAESFPEVLLSKINDSQRTTINHQPFRGVVQNQVNEEGVYSLSINSGYFKVGTPAGISNNRELKFVVNEDGYLRTFSRDTDLERQTVGENFVLDRSGQPIRVENPGDIQITANGNVVSGGQVVGNLVHFPPNHVIGTTSGGVRLSRVASDFTDGTYINTDNDLDFAIKGEGFFKVADAEGNEFYTRDGAFTLNQQGLLMTKDGYTVVGTNGPITIPSGGTFELSGNGTIYVDNQQVGQLNIVTVENKHEMRKYGDNLFSMEEGFEAEEAPFQGEVISGYLEGSNVTAVKEMVQLITAYRNYEANQKVITNQDELLSKVVNELGRI